MRPVHVVVPDAVNEPAQPSGGNRYDRKVCDGLAALGWDVRVHAVAAGWPVAEHALHAHLSRELALIPSGSVVVVDGLIASATGQVLVPQACRLVLVTLMHMPVFDKSECAVLRAASAVITTSRWTRDRLEAEYDLAPGRLHVARPGVDPADLATGATGDLLSVAAVTPVKGHDVLVRALARLTDRDDWTCRCIGPLDRDPAFAERMIRLVADLGLADRVVFEGVRIGADLAAAYTRSGVLVSASRAETFGMAVAEALAHGLPVIGTAVGGVPEALGTTPAGAPGLLVAPDNDVALAHALRSWLDDAALRAQLRSAALGRRPALPAWAATVERIAAVLRVIR